MVISRYSSEYRLYALMSSPNSKFQIPNSKQIPNPNDQKLIKTTRVILYIMIGMVFVWFFLHDLNPSGVLEVSYNLCKPSPYISELSPHGRVLEIEKKQGYCEQKMVIDPVYVDVRLPQRYDRVWVRLEYTRPRDQPLTIGVRTSLSDWQWRIIPFEGSTHSRAGIAQFDLHDVPLDRRRTRFILSSPGLSASGQEILLRHVTFRFEKPRFSKAMVRRWATSFLVAIEI